MTQANFIYFILLLRQLVSPKVDYINEKKNLQLSLQMKNTQHTMEGELREEAEDVARLNFPCLNSSR